MKPVPEQKGINAIPVVTTLFVDKIALTIDIPLNKRKLVHEGCTNLAKSTENYINKRKPLYENSLRIRLTDHIGNDSTLSLQWQPRNITHSKTGKQMKLNYLRLEWNPAKLDIKTVKSILELNTILPDGFDSLLHEGTISRIDLAVDVKHIKPGNLLFYFPGIQCSQNRLKSGKIQTAYLGTEESEKQFVIYDKKEEIIKKNKKLAYKYPVPVLALTRVELRLRPEKSMGFKQLMELNNPFSKLELTASPKPTPAGKTGSDEYRLLQRLCFWEGVNQGLSLISDKTKKNTYREQLLRESLNTFWEPVKVWQGLPAALEDAGFHVTKLEQEIHATPSSE